MNSLFKKCDFHRFSTAEFYTQISCIDNGGYFLNSFYSANFVRKEIKFKQSISNGAVFREKGLSILSLYPSQFTIIS